MFCEVDRKFKYFKKLTKFAIIDLCGYENYPLTVPYIKEKQFVSDKT